MRTLQLFSASALALIAATPEEITRSLRETGFAVLKGHPIAAERIDAAYADWGRFFASDAKDSFRAEPGGAAGYFPFRTENAKGARHKDLKEFFQVYPGTRLPPESAEVTKGLYGDLMEIGATLLAWLDEHAPAETRRGFSEPLTSMLRGSNECMLRIIHYPALDNVVVEELPVISGRVQTAVVFDNGNDQSIDGGQIAVHVKKKK